MKLHKINFSINFETNTLQDDEYDEILDALEAQMKNNKAKGIPFEEFAEIIPLKKIIFHPSVIQYPDLNWDDEYSIKETKVEVRA